MVFCLSTISQQWIYGGGCTWYFVPLSTLTSHSRWSKKLRDTSSLWWKSPEKNFLLPPKGPFVSHLVRPSATDINVDQQKEMQNINKTPPLCSTGLSLSVYNKNPLKTYTNLLFFSKVNFCVSMYPYFHNIYLLSSCLKQPALYPNFDILTCLLMQSIISNNQF